MPTPNELDIVLVANPDVNCDGVDSEEGWSHKDFFQIKWSGQPHRIIPGQTKRMPRFLAEHYAKHLADHILIKLEASTGRRGLVQSPNERKRVLQTILLTVEDYYHSATEPSEGDRVSKLVDNLNPFGQLDKEEKSLDLGVLPNAAVGVLVPEPPSLDQIMKNAGVESTPAPAPNEPPIPDLPDDKKTSIYDPKKPKPSKKELLETAYHMNIAVTGKETVDQLISKLKSF